MIRLRYPFINFYYVTKVINHNPIKKQHIPSMLIVIYYTHSVTWCCFCTLFLYLILHFQTPVTSSVCKLRPPLKLLFKSFSHSWKSVPLILLGSRRWKTFIEEEKFTPLEVISNMVKTCLYRTWAEPLFGKKSTALP